MRQLKEMVFEKKIKTRVPKGKGKGY